MEKLFRQIEKTILYTVVVLFPFFVIPTSPNPFVVPKLTILSLGIALLLLARCLRVLFSGKLDLSIGNFDFPVFVLAAAYIVSTILRTPNKMEAFLLPGTTTVLVGSALLYYFINQLRESEKQVVSMLLYISGAIFAFITLLSFSGLLAKIPQLPAFYKAQGFTPEGGYLPAAVFLGVLLPIGAGLLLSEKQTSRKVLVAVASFFILSTFAVSVYEILPGKNFSPRFPSFATGWSISIDSLKDSPFFGVGPGNYLTAFNRFRPISYNNTDLWAIKFTTARDLYLTVFTEAGLLGIAGFALLLWTIYTAAKRDIKEKKMVNWGFAASSTLVSLVLIAAIFLFVPGTPLLIFIFFVLLALNAHTRHTSLNLTTQASTETSGISTQMVASRFPALLLTLPVIIFVIVLSIRGYKIVLAEYKFQKALDLLVQNNAAGTYDTMREAIALDPQVDRYHATFSRINLALANAIAQKATQNGPDGQPQQLTDTDRTNITTLIQQSINEAKAAVALNPLRAGEWELLGQTYRSISGLAQGANDFAIQSYRQAVALDPINPNLRIALGGVYFANQDYVNAANVFQLAAQAKPDLANAHYNYALALDREGSLDSAISEMTLVLSLIKDKNSQDYQVAKKALEDIQAKKKEATPQGGEQLTSPQTQVPEITPPVQLPEGAEPPATPLSPTPSPLPTTEGGLQISPTVSPQP
jgi:tetratricopeptide (TPR) repeat protein